MEVRDEAAQQLSTVVQIKNNPREEAALTKMSEVSKNLPRKSDRHALQEEGTTQSQGAIEVVSHALEGQKTFSTYKQYRGRLFECTLRKLFSLRCALLYLIHTGTKQGIARQTKTLALQQVMQFFQTLL